MHNGLTHWSQVITNWELVGLGMFGEGAQGNSEAGSQDDQGLQHSWQCVLETMGLSHNQVTTT